MKQCLGNITTDEDHPVPSRRRFFLQGAGGLIAAAALPIAEAVGAPIPEKQSPKSTATAAPDLTGQLARYMVAARDNVLPPKVLMDAKIRVLDALGAIISGSRLTPGEAAIRFIRTQGGTPESSILGTDIKTTAINAAMINGMFAHADETDDVEPVTKAHPGCCTVSTAMAMAEREQRSGMDVLRAVALGYDVGCRFVIALGPGLVRASHRGVEGPLATMASVAVAASLARLDETQTRYALSYAAQQVSGLWSWVDDPDHIEKSFDISGMGARNGVTAVMLVEAGCTGVHDVLSGTHNAIQALSSQPHPEAMMADLGSKYFVSSSGIKTYSAGYPTHSALASFFALRKQYDLRPDNVEHIVVRLPEDGPGIVSHSPMPNVNCEYLIAMALVDGSIGFAKSHSREYMADPQIQAVMQRVQVVGDPKLNDPAAPRSGGVDVTLRDGRTVSQFTKFPPGSPQNPVDQETLAIKARDLIAPVLGAEKTDALIKRMNALEAEGNMRDLVRSLMTV